MKVKRKLAEDRREQSPRAVRNEQQLCNVLTEAIWLNGLLNRFRELEKQLYEIFSKPARLNELVVQFLKLAQHGNGGIGKQLAGEVLACIYVSLHKHHGKLKKVNPAYQKTVTKKIRADVLLPKSVCQILQEELRTAERYQFKLLIIREEIREQPRLHHVTADKKAVERRLQDELVWQHFGAGSGALWTPEGIREIEKRAREGAADPGRIYPGEVTEKRRATWQDLAEHSWKIPEEYWPTADLKPLCGESQPEWLGFSGRASRKQ